MPTTSHSNARHPVRIIAINGSLRTGSYTRMALAVALRGARELGAQTSLLDLRDFDLPYCDGKLSDDEAPESVMRLRRALRHADGILIGTPEYHGSFSGVLKNAIDHMGFAEFEGKMVGLIGVSGGRMGATIALNSLHTIARALHAWVVPEQASIPEAWRNFDKDGNSKQEDLEKRLLGVGRQVARFAFLHTSDKTRDFLRAWEQAFENPGGGQEVELAAQTA